MGLFRVATTAIDFSCCVDNIKATCRCFFFRHPMDYITILSEISAADVSPTLRQQVYQIQKAPTKQEPMKRVLAR
ncbi:hypothetical protein CHS0354_026901 [Potamilus streckersoni]|uniref:Uncharacterized protein n=1 Tax=Potamilus streckersoni TaxID=2493646 RepID=A0AAE0SPQ8_9BIVA|nr:hypothetical protein CHS0354_026901 [Potamilus streckersoni]